MKNRRNFWDRTAIIYDRFMRRDAAAYDRMYALLRPVVRDKTVLELAAGTGLIAKHIANAAEYIEVTDASEQMIRQAEREDHAENLHFSVQDMFCLPYADAAFDVVIVSNALHIVPQPERALHEIKRVLKNDGVLAAPTFTHAENSFSGKGQSLSDAAGRLSAAQQMDKRGISGLSDGKTGGPCGKASCCRPLFR